MFIIDNKMESYLIEASKGSNPVVQSVNIIVLTKLKEEVQKTKAIYYKDIYL
jgi:hypothetical protein